MHGCTSTVILCIRTIAAGAAHQLCLHGAGGVGALHSLMLLPHRAGCHIWSGLCTRHLNAVIAILLSLLSAMVRHAVAQAGPGSRAQLPRSIRGGAHRGHTVNAPK